MNLVLVSPLQDTLVRNLIKRWFCYYPKTKFKSAGCRNVLDNLWIFSRIYPCPNMVEEINTKHLTRSRCYIDCNENTEKVHTKKSMYQLKKTNITSFVLESFRLLRPKIWALILSKIKSTKSSTVFKE